MWLAKGDTEKDLVETKEKNIRDRITFELDKIGKRSKQLHTTMTERLCHIPIIYGMGFRMKTTLNIDDSVMAELKREAARQGRTMSELVETALECGRVPSADEIRALRRARVSAAEAKKVGDARRASEARLRSSWDSYCGAIEAARGGNVARLVDCLRARKAVADGDRDRLAAFVATKVRRRRWPPELVRALGRGAPTEGDFDLLADLVEVIGRRPSGVRDQPVHRAARLAEVLLSLLGRRVPNAMRTAVIEYACEAEGDDAGVAIEPERVRDLLNRPKARRQY